MIHTKPFTLGENTKRGDKWGRREWICWVYALKFFIKNINAYTQQIHLQKKT